jgi:hypothetical protein
VESADRVKDMRERNEALRSKLKGMEDLPPDVHRAAIVIQRAKQRLAELEQMITDKM